MKPLTRKRIWLARAIAIVADGVQIGLFPLFSEGFISPLDDAFDVAVCLVLTLLVGWHWAFLPSVAVKLAPILDEAPTWTLAVFIATRKREMGPSGIGSKSIENSSEAGPGKPDGKN